MTAPKYKNPELEIREWMLSVMRDRNQPLSTRMDVANRLMELWPEQFVDRGQEEREPWPGEVQVTIRIETSLGKEVPDPDPEPQTKTQDASVLEQLNHAKGWH